MRKPIMIFALALFTTGCATSSPSGRTYPEARSANVVPVAQRPERSRAPRGLKGVPPGHYPRPGECRLWYPGRPPGQQPRAVPCESLHGRVPSGAFILFGGRPWDSLYDWVGHERGAPGSVPQSVVRLMMTVQVR
jgi:hypothetical protein